MDSKSPNRYIDRADFYVDYMLDFSSAYVDFSKAIEIEPDNAKLYYKRGYFLLWSLNAYDKAEKDFEKVLHLESNNVGAMNMLGLLYKKISKVDLAIEMFSKGISTQCNCLDEVAFCYRNRA